MKLHKKHVVPGALAAVSLIGAIVCAGISSHVTGTQTVQSAAERWGADSEQSFAQVSVFFTEDAGFLTSSAEGIREDIDRALTAASLEAKGKDTRLWYDAWSTQRGTVRVQGTRKLGTTALVTAVGGDFFRMHPLTLADGGYLSPEDLMQDRVIIDTQLAWEAFGSSEVAGMEIRIDGTTYQIAGVVEPETDSASRTAYGEKARLYMPYAPAAQQTNPYSDAYYDGTSSSSAQSDYIGCYEAVLPNPVRGFAEKTIQDAIYERDGMQIVSNTGRDSLTRRWENLRHLREMVIADTGIAYPYWENAARMADFSAARLLLLEILFLLFPVLYGLWLLWKGYRRLERFLARKREAHKRKYRTIEKDPYSI